MDGWMDGQKETVPISRDERILLVCLCARTYTFMMLSFPDDKEVNNAGCEVKSNVCLAVDN